MNRTTRGMLALACVIGLNAYADIARPTLEKGDNLVVCGDSITFHAAALPFGFHHQLTNAFAKTCPEKNLTVASLGFSGYQVGSWIDLDRKSRTQEVWTHFKKPGWSVSAVLSNKVDAIAVFLGMNDILMPSMDGSPDSVDKWGARLKRLVKALREHTGAKKVVLCTTTPLTADAASPKNIVRLEMGDRLRKVANEENCGVADFGRAVMDAIDDCRRVSSVFQPVPDFVHPQKLGHIAMARELCRAFGETKAVEALSRDYDAELASVSRASEENVVWRLHPLTKDGRADEHSYRIEWFWHDTAKARAGDNPVKATFDIPKGWAIVSRKDGARAGEVVVKGVPDRIVNPVSIALAAGPVVKAAVIGIPTPWRVSSGWNCREVWCGTTWQTNVAEHAEADRAAADAALKGPWTYVTGTRDYKGGGAPGSLDPYQATFGTTVDSIWAVRYVKSEKDREVEGLLSHVTFSISGGFTLYVNGEKVFADFLNRNGKNKSHVPAFRLRKGWNEIRLRVDHNSWERQFSFDLVPCDVDDLSALRYGPTLPPAETVRLALAEMSATEVSVKDEDGVVLAHYTLKPTPVSRIRCAVGLPAATNWNGRLRGYGSGGKAGKMDAGGTVLGAARRGYVGAFTDLGSSMTPDLKRENLVDFGHRSTHLMTVSAKRLAEALYGRKPDYSYFSGESTGGGQGFHEMLRYPEDYDGILSGVPAFRRLALHTYFHKTGALVAKFTKAEKKAVDDAAIAYYADKDEPWARGRFLTDTVWNEKAGPAILDRAEAACPSLKTPEKRAALESIFRGQTVNGKPVYSGMPLSGLEKSYFCHDWIFDWILNAEGGAKKSADLADDDLARILREYADIFDADGTDVSAFVKRGGKMICWGGAEDSVVPAPPMAEWFKAVKDDGAFRFYLLPGRWHNHGRGVQELVDPQGVLERWVEKGEAPGALPGRFADGTTRLIAPLDEVL